MLNKVTGNPSRKTVCPGLDPVTEVVDVASCAPPSGDQELRSRFRLDKLQMCDSGVIGICSEAVLLIVRAAEDVVSKAEGAQNSDRAKNSKDQRIYR